MRIRSREKRGKLNVWAALFSFDDSPRPIGSLISHIEITENKFYVDRFRLTRALGCVVLAVLILGEKVNLSLIGTFGERERIEDIFRKVYSYFTLSFWL